MAFSLRTPPLALRRVAAAVLMAVMLAGCATRKAAPADAAGTMPLPDKGQTWLLTAVQGRALDPLADGITLVINPEAGTLKGQAPCNRYSANCSMGRGAMAVSHLEHTRVQCPEAEMRTEQRYLGLLGKATSYTLQGYTLTLYNNNREILKFGLQ